MKTYDVIIVGAGIVGAACAFECARSGMRVAVLDRDIVGGGATAAGMGHIVIMDDSEAQFALTRFSQQLWQELSPELPPSIEYRQCGTIWVAAEVHEMKQVQNKSAYYAKRGVRTEVLDSHELGKLEPHLRTGLVGGLLVPEDAVLYPPRAAQFLMNRAQQLGAKCHTDCTVSSIRSGRVITRNGGLSASVVINATGAWAAALTPGIPVRKRKGHLVITDKYPSTASHQLVELGYLNSAGKLETDSVAFNVQPRITGQLLIGSSRQYAAEETEVDPDIFREMLQRAESYMPELASYVCTRSWTGFRAATPDKLPLIGQWPAAEKLLLATGHEGLGISTSLATARILADQILGRPSAIPVEAFSPARFAAGAPCD